MGYSTFDHKTFHLLPDKKVLMSRLTDPATGLDIQIIAVTSDCSAGYRHKVSKLMNKVDDVIIKTGLFYLA